MNIGRQLGLENKGCKSTGWTFFAAEDATHLISDEFAR